MKKKIIRKIHITNVKAGDTVIHNGKETTICQKDISDIQGIGGAIFGDCYNLGYKTVQIVYWTN